MIAILLLFLNILISNRQDQENKILFTNYIELTNLVLHKFHLLIPSTDCLISSIRTKHKTSLPISHFLGSAIYSENILIFKNSNMSKVVFSCTPLLLSLPTLHVQKTQVCRRQMHYKDINIFQNIYIYKLNQKIIKFNLIGLNI